MRKAFDHDRLSYNRRTNQEYLEVKKTYLSVLLSGTPAQVKPLIPSSENGLFSRELFYYMPAIHRWQSQFDKDDHDLEETFRALGREWKEKREEIVMNGIFTLRLTDGQKDEFNRIFSSLFVRSGLANGINILLSVAPVRGIFLWGGLPPVSLDLFCGGFHLLPDRTGPVGIVGRRPQLIVRRLPLS